MLIDYIKERPFIGFFSVVFDLVISGFCLVGWWFCLFFEILMKAVDFFHRKLNKVVY